jgi:hypothetical protein
MDVQCIQYAVHRGGYKSRKSPTSVGIAPTRKSASIDMLLEPNAGE